MLGTRTTSCAREQGQISFVLRCIRDRISDAEHFLRYARVDRRRGRTTAVDITFGFVNDNNGYVTR
jgi:hypothetical protein